MSNKKNFIDPRIIGQTPNRQGITLTPEMVNKGQSMTCINEIPLNDKPGEFKECGGEVFVDAFRLKYISPIMSPVGRQTIGTLMIGKMCVTCGKIFNPDEWMKRQQEIEKAIKGTVLDKKGG